MKQTETILQSLVRETRNLRKKNKFSIKLFDYQNLIKNEVINRPFFRNSLPLKKQKEMGMI